MISKVGYLKEHDIDIILAKPNEKLNENNSLLIQLSRFSGGSQFNQTISTAEGVSATWINSLNFSFIHHMTLSSFFWGAGFEYDFLNITNFHFQGFVITPSIGYVLIKNPVFSLETFLDIDLSTGAYVTVSNSHVTNEPGFIFGPLFGLRLIVVPKSNYKVFGTLSYRDYQAYQFGTTFRTDPTNPNADDKLPGFSSLGGINLGIGVMYDF